MEKLKEFEIYKNGTQQGTVMAKNLKEAQAKVFATYGEHREVYEVENDEFKRGGGVEHEGKYAKGSIVKGENILIKGVDLTDDQKSMLRFQGMKDSKFVKNHSFWFKNGKPSTEEGFYYPVVHSFSHLEYAKGGGVGNKYAKEDKAMLHNQNKQIMHHSKEIEKIINNQKHIEPWVVAKMNRATTDLSDLTHYLDGEKKAKGGNLGFTYTIGGL